VPLRSIGLQALLEDIAGTKSEDTIIAAPQGPEIISASPGFPTVEVRAAGITLKRADILVR